MSRFHKKISAIFLLPLLLLNFPLTAAIPCAMENRAAAEMTCCAMTQHDSGEGLAIVGSKHCSCEIINDFENNRTAGVLNGDIKQANLRVEKFSSIASAFLPQLSEASPTLTCDSERHNPFPSGQKIYILVSAYLI